MRSFVMYLNLYINANRFPVFNGYFLIAYIKSPKVVKDGLESNAIRAARIPSLIQELLRPFRVIPIALLDLFGPLFKGDINTPSDYPRQSPGVATWQNPYSRSR